MNRDNWSSVYSIDVLVYEHTVIYGLNMTTMTLN